MYVRYMLSPVRRLSVTYNVRAPYSAFWNFRQFFFAVWYLGHRLTSTEILQRSSQGTPSGCLNAKGVAKYSDFWHLECYTIPKRCKIGGKLVLITNRKSYELPKSVTLNGEMALILRYFTEHGSFRGALRLSGWK